MNNVTVVGNIGKDGVELRFSGSGTAVASFTVYESFKPKDGGERIYHNYRAAMFGQTAENFAESAEAGDSVILVGRLEQSRWETKDGDKRSEVKLVVSDAGLSVRWNTVQAVRNERSG